jgi:hypothetical protein
VRFDLEKLLAGGGIPHADGGKPEIPVVVARHDALAIAAESGAMEPPRFLVVDNEECLLRIGLFLKVYADLPERQQGR